MLTLFLATTRDKKVLKSKYFEYSPLERNTAKRILEDFRTEWALARIEETEYMTKYGVYPSITSILISAGNSEVAFLRRTGHRDTTSLEGYHNQCGSNREGLILELL